MKKFFKTALPVTLLLLAFGMAFNTNAMNKKKGQTTQVGWKHLSSASSCDTSIECQIESGDDCLDGTLQVYRKNAQGVCNIKMFRIPD